MGDEDRGEIFGEVEGEEEGVSVCNGLDMGGGF